MDMILKKFEPRRAWNLKFFYHFFGGMTSGTVLCRSIAVSCIWSVISTALYFILDDSICCIGKLLDVEDMINFKKNYNENGTGWFWPGLLVLVSAVYTAFRSEYTSKYIRLANIHDEFLPGNATFFKFKSKKITFEELNFIEDCINYYLHSDPGLKPTFDKIISSVFVYIIQNIDKKNDIEKIEKIKKCIELNYPLIHYAIRIIRNNNEYRSYLEDLNREVQELNFPI